MFLKQHLKLSTISWAPVLWKICGKKRRYQFRDPMPSGAWSAWASISKSTNWMLLLSEALDLANALILLFLMAAFLFGSPNSLVCRHKSHQMKCSHMSLWSKINREVKQSWRHHCESSEGLLLMCCCFTPLASFWFKSLLEATECHSELIA